MPDIFIFAGHNVISDFERCQILQNRLYSSRHLGKPLVAVLLLSSWRCRLTPRSSLSSLAVGLQYANSEIVTPEHPASVLHTDLLMVFKSWRCHLTPSCSPDSAASVVASHRVAHWIQQLALSPDIELLTGFSRRRCCLASSCSPDSAAGVVASHRDTHPAIGPAAPCVLVLLLT